MLSNEFLWQVDAEKEGVGQHGWVDGEAQHPTRRNLTRRPLGSECAEGCTSGDELARKLSGSKSGRPKTLILPGVPPDCEGRVRWAEGALAWRKSRRSKWAGWRWEAGMVAGWGGRCRQGGEWRLVRGRAGSATGKKCEAGVKGVMSHHVVRLLGLAERLNCANDHDDLQLANCRQSLPGRKRLTAEGGEGGAVIGHQGLRRRKEVSALFKGWVSLDTGVEQRGASLWSM